MISHRQQYLKLYGALTFDEELELYDLLEMDTGGDDDPEVRFDDTTEDILLG